MAFKKHNPGCPCACGGEPPTGPCGCSSTQIKIDVTDAADIITIEGIRFIPGPCNYMDFTGFSAIEGTYYVDWPFEGGTVELGRWASTNGPLTDALGTKYCVYAKLDLSVPAVPGDDACDGFLCLCIYVETIAGSSCQSINDVVFLSCLYLNCGSFSETNDVEIALCVPGSRSVSQPTTNGDIDCPTKYYDWTVEWEPV